MHPSDPAAVPSRASCLLRAIVAAAAFAAGPAMACTVTLSPLVFGQINPLMAAAADTVSAIEVTCPATTSYSISSSHSADGVRQMSNGAGDTLDYQIYTDASLSSVWGDGTAGTHTITGQADTEGHVHEVHGRVRAQPYAVPGTYSDTVFVTITY